MAMDEIQISYGQNGKPLIQPRTLTTKFDHEVWPQNNHFDHWPWGRFQDVSGHGQIFWPLTMGQIPGCHGHGQCLTPPPSYLPKPWFILLLR